MATGTFEVKLGPQAPHPGVGDPAVARMSIDKTFDGDLSGTAKGEMLAVRTDVEGSAGYVALERVAGTLQGHSGTFVLQHTGVMDRGAPKLTVTVVPDSGTDELTGLTGSMKIDVVDGSHTYALDYSLPERPAD
ncbi:MAG TPA: DUF3224 domain-containing protein [Actinomycetota bacterium]|nr:DUF3224 domain-containing protein [Actinomycetota bacterium]